MAIVVAFALMAHAVVHQEAAPIAVEKWCFRKDLSEGLGIPAGCTNLHLASKPITDEEVGAPATRPPMLARFARISLTRSIRASLLSRRPRCWATLCTTTRTSPPRS